ncbi:MAG: carbohydrate kinase family protein [Trueperaceae bacterium]|nr:carbohydrate kinase family protein [Trueperaceae bacterium]MCO5174563.1 carbohydrate kinase family protein [Trueperaceae bacterium]MCW5818926.1 carbohydrate kinase family protein [Trueperaceae bacterium]
MPELVGVGHICQDHLCVVEAYPPEDGSTRITEIEFQGGGAAATATVAAARLGIDAALIGNLGADRIGDEIADELLREGVDISAVDRLEGVRSLSSYVMICPTRGTRTKFPFKDRMPPIAWSERQREVLSGAKVLHLDGTHYENAVRAAALAKDHGVTVSLDGSTRQSDNALNRRLAGMADVLITNSVYPMLVSGKGSLSEALLEMSTWGPEFVAATVGQDGVYAVLGGEVRHYPAFSVAVVDTTGAGDVFHGAFLAARLRGKGVEECIRFAQYAAGKKCGQMGGRRGIPDWATVESGLEASNAKNATPKQATPKEVTK